MLHHLAFVWNGQELVSGVNIVFITKKTWSMNLCHWSLNMMPEGETQYKIINCQPKLLKLWYVEAVPFRQQSLWQYRKKQLKMVYESPGTETHVSPPSEDRFLGIPVAHLSVPKLCKRNS